MHHPYWITCYIMSYPLYICLLVSVSTSNFILPASILLYHILPLPLTPTPLYLPEPPLLHYALLSLVYPDQAAPTITLIVAVQDSAQPPEIISS